MALITVDNQHIVGTNSARLCMPVKVLQLVKTKLISSLAVFGDADNLVLRQGFILVLVRQVLAGFKDDVGWNSLSCSINALNNRYLLLVA
jgi:hypothetical protein